VLTRMHESAGALISSQEQDRDTTTLSLTVNIIIIQILNIIGNPK
jgi:hypothetical protein